MRVRSLDWEDVLEEETATHSSVLAWRIPWTEEPGGLQSVGSQESDTTERLTLVFIAVVLCFIPLVQLFSIHHLGPIVRSFSLSVQQG